MMFRRSTARLLTGPLAFLIAGVIDVAAALMTHRPIPKAPAMRVARRGRAAVQFSRTLR